MVLLLKELEPVSTQTSLPQLAQTSLSQLAQKTGSGKDNFRSYGHTRLVATIRSPYH
jgi:hypothetical protein